MHYKWMPLHQVEKFVPLARALGVSTVARSQRGFLTQYRKAGGNASRLSAYWRNRRDNFVARHMAQVEHRDEPLFESDGQPTRRHLALIMWAYSPYL